MVTISEVIRARFSGILTARSAYEANGALRWVRERDGLGVAILVAWQYGLSGSRPHIDPWGSRVRVRGADHDCPYVFVHAPARRYRHDTAKLIAMGLFNPDADPALLVFHEDGLIGAFSFLKPAPEGLTEDGIDEILRALAQQGFLVPVNIENRQIQFKDLEVKWRIAAYGKQVYVRIDYHSLGPSYARLPAGYEREEIWEYVRESLKYKSACNYCSLQAFRPREVTVSSAYARTPNSRMDEKVTVRNYQFGFTFAPIGDPHDVCHFLAWDFPHISDLVMNMEPQACSIGDLVRLVRMINRDIADFCSSEGVENLQISGVYNHWAGASTYHPHYQFFRIAPLPLLLASNQSEVLVTYQDVEVRRLSASWPAAAFVIRSSGTVGDEDVIEIADSLAREWSVLNEGEDGNRFADKIAVENHSQNIFVTIDQDQLIVVFIPRRLDRLNAKCNGIGKENAGVLEMMGYFIIEKPEDFDVIDEMSAQQRRALGDSWLAQLGPPAKLIEEFEGKVKVSLSTAVDSYEQRIVDQLLLNRLGDWRTKDQKLASAIDRDSQAMSPQTAHLPIVEGWLMELERYRPVAVHKTLLSLRALRPGTPPERIAALCVQAYRDGVHPDAVVLALAYSGSFVSGLAARKALSEIKSVFSSAGSDPDEKRDWLREFNVGLELLAAGSLTPSARLAGETGNHVFISYVTDDSEIVDRLERDLGSFGIGVWRDRSSLGAGDRWKDSIRHAIASGGFFLCCFSEASRRRTRSYMNEELTLAVEELRIRSRDRTWFLPVILSGGELPDWPIGAGETLRDFNYVSLFPDTWYEGVRKLVQTIKKSDMRLYDKLLHLPLWPIWSSIATGGCPVALRSRPFPRPSWLICARPLSRPT